MTTEQKIADKNYPIKGGTLIKRTYFLYVGQRGLCKCKILSIEEEEHE